MSEWELSLCVVVCFRRRWTTWKWAANTFNCSSRTFMSAVTSAFVFPSSQILVCFLLLIDACSWAIVTHWTNLCGLLPHYRTLMWVLGPPQVTSYTAAVCRFHSPQVTSSAGAPQVISYTGALCRCPAVEVVNSGWCYLEKYSLVERLSSYVCSCLGMLPRDSWALCWLFGCVSVCCRTK